MSKPQDGISRRRFVSVGALVAGAGCADAPKTDLQVLTAAEASLIEALFDRIIPADDAPGAVAAGCLNYLDTQLAAALSRFTPVYRASLPALDTASKRIAGAGFLDLGDAARDSFLKKLEAGEAEGEEWADLSGQAFFRLAVQHCMQGFYGSPKHGGNIEAASFKMLGVERVMH